MRATRMVDNTHGTRTRAPQQRVNDDGGGGEGRNMGKQTVRSSGERKRTRA